MKNFLIRAASALLLASFALSANAATVTGTWLSSGQWSLIHAGSSAGGTGDAADFLRWLPDQEVIFDLTATTLTASGPQDFDLISSNGDGATFTLQSATLDLSDTDGFFGGTMDYSLTVDSGPLVGTYMGTFTFANDSFSGTLFNSSSIENGVFNIYLWGGDVANDIGIDVGLSTVVPIPAPLLLFASGLFGLGLTRRRR